MGCRATDDALDRRGNSAPGCPSSAEESARVWLLGPAPVKRLLILRLVGGLVGGGLSLLLIATQTALAGTLRLPESSRRRKPGIFSLYFLKRFLSSFAGNRSALGLDLAGDL